MKWINAITVGNFKEAAVKIMCDAALELMIKKELALRAADAMGISREQAETDIAEVLDYMAKQFDETGLKDQITSKVIVHEEEAK